MKTLRTTIISSLIISLLAVLGCSDETYTLDVNGEHSDNNPPHVEVPADDDEAKDDEAKDDEKCTDACEPSRECLDDNTISICGYFGGSKCTEKATETCPQGQVCRNGQCTDAETGCKDACTVDACDSEKTILLCRDDNGDGCLEPVSQPCSDDHICKDGKCQKSCQDACSPGVECDGTDALRTCRDDNEDGCLEWVTESCPADTSCSDGACRKPEVTCKDTCSGTTECEGTTGYKTCKDTDGDGCKEWTSVTKCGSNQACSDGKCQTVEPSCQDTCSGTTACEGTTGYKTCKDTNGDGCKEWTSVTKCGSNQACSDGKCQTVSCKYTSAVDPGIHPMSSESKYGTSESVTTNGFTDEYLYDANNYIKIGARREWGGSIIFFGLADGKKGTNSSNTIDSNDTGREVQVAIYDGSRQSQNCAYNATCGQVAPACPISITYLGWNPVQGGNRCNRGSGVEAVKNKNGIMEIITNPLHWNPNWDAKDCTSTGCSTNPERRSDVRLTQRLRFVSTHVVELFYSVQNLAAIDHTQSAQELPTLYAAYGAHGLQNLRRLMRPDKTEIAINESANDGFFVKTFQSTEPWVTLQNADLTYGVGILYENGLLDYQGWQKAGIFNNVRSLLRFALPANGMVNARAYLILGNFDTIQNQAHWLMKTIPPFGVLDVPAEGAVVSGKQVNISGWALDNKQVNKITARIDESTTVNLNYGNARPDVCKVWIGYPMCSNVGFNGTIDVSNLNKNCRHLLEIIATDNDGNTRTIARRLLTVK